MSMALGTYKVYDTEKILKFFLKIIFGSCNNTIFRKKKMGTFSLDSRCTCIYKRKNNFFCLIMYIHMHNRTV